MTELRVAPIVLTIAGFDPSGGAGILADVRTFVHFNVGPTAAITSLTFQNSAGAFGAVHETAESVRAQILPIVEEHRIAAVKIGMLPTSEIVLEVARLVAELDLPAPVIDPVMRTTSGYELADSDAIRALVTELIPLARMVTPNIPEAEALTGLRITSEEEMRTAAVRLREMDARAVLIKGGHLYASANGDERRGREAVDVLDDEGQLTVFRSAWIESANVRGTGCMLSSAIAACLAKEMTLKEAVSSAKEFVRNTLNQGGTERAPFNS